MLRRLGANSNPSAVLNAEDRLQSEEFSDGRREAGRDLNRNREMGTVGEGGQRPERGNETGKSEMSGKLRLQVEKGPQAWLKPLLLQQDNAVELNELGFQEEAAREETRRL